MLRALRVLIDIGVHYEHWTDEQALKLWQQYLPTKMKIAERELARIKRWPVQVITYVYGKHHIEQLIEKIKMNKGEETEAQIRNAILRLGNQPLVSAETVSHFLKRSRPL